VRERVPDARLLLVGEAGSRFDLDARLGSLDLPPEALLRVQHVDEARFVALMAACDVVVSLRAPTMGETSGSVVRALSLGKPVVVSDLGWFAELPDDVAFKAPVDALEVERLAAALELLLGNRAARDAMGRAARDYAEREHGLERVADLYAAALEEAAGGPAVRRSVVAEVAAAAVDVGIEPGSEEAVELAARLREARVGE
jgi:glycosyltransferase involved in cell wall biosynthesis